MDENNGFPATIRPVVKKNKTNPFASGFIPTGKRKKATTTYLTRRSLLKTMLEVDLTIQDLPTVLADHVRSTLPGWFDDVERKFTMRQIMELVQFQLLFSPSDHVKQDAINSIKDRVDGKAVQKMIFETEDPDPTELVLPNGRKIIL